MTPASNRNLSARSTVKISDLAILYGALKSKVWQYFFTKKWPKIIDLTVLHYFRFSRAILGLIYWSPLRYKTGSQTLGATAYLSAISCCLGYNSSSVHPFFKPFSMFIAPFMLCGKTNKEWYEFVFIDIESKFLLMYSGLLLISGLVHLMTIWLSKGNFSMSKRGNSYLVLGLSKYMKVNEYFIVGILEPLLVLGIAFLLWTAFEDRYGAVFLGAAALSEAVQQLLDQTHKEHLKSIIKT